MLGAGCTACCACWTPGASWYCHWLLLRASSKRWRSMARWRATSAISCSRCGDTSWGDATCTSWRGVRPVPRPGCVPWGATLPNAPCMASRHKPVMEVAHCVNKGTTAQPKQAPSTHALAQRPSSPGTRQSKNGLVLRSCASRASARARALENCYVPQLLQLHTPTRSCHIVALWFFTSSARILTFCFQFDGNCAGHIIVSSPLEKNTGVRLHVETPRPARFVSRPRTRWSRVRELHLATLRTPNGRLSSGARITTTDTIALNTYGKLVSHGVGGPRLQCRQGHRRGCQVGASKARRCQ